MNDYDIGTSLYEMESKYLVCDCGEELIQLTADLAYISEWSDVQDMLFISLYSYGLITKRRFNWRSRIKHIWHIIRYGTPHKDCIVLGNKERHKLMDYLNEIEERKQQMLKDSKVIGPNDSIEKMWDDKIYGVETTKSLNEG